MNKKKETHLKVADSLDKPRSNSVFKRRAKDTIKIAGATIVGLMLLGNANKTYGQPKVKQGTELSGNQNKLGWGELKAKFGPAEKKMPNVYGPEYYKIILVDGVIIIGDGLLPLDYAKKDDVHASSKAHATETEVVEAHFTKVNGIPVCYKIFNDGILGIALRYDGKNLYTQQAYAGKDGDELIGNTYIAPNGTQSVCESKPYLGLHRHLIDSF